MSLDVYLREQKPCPHCGQLVTKDDCLWHRNITHNLGNMAEEAKLYVVMWRPEYGGIIYARQAAPLLVKGINLLHKHEKEMRRHTPANGWGSYEGLLEFAIEYLRACELYPNAVIEVSL